MTKVLPFAALALSLLLLGCVESGQYPVSGEECTASDPVLDLDATDCTPPTGTSGM